MRSNCRSCGCRSDGIGINHSCPSGQPVVALAGNPNTGKTTLFNALTGLNQHTGNWPGKTVLQSKGTVFRPNINFTLVDLPGTYSILSNSAEEQIAREFIFFDRPDATVVVVDASCLERNLSLVLQILEIAPLVVTCVNLIDEAARKGINVDLKALSRELGVPVVGTVALTGQGLEELLESLDAVLSGSLVPKPNRVVYDDVIEAEIGKLEPLLLRLLSPGWEPRWAALRLLEGDNTILQALREYPAAGDLLKAGGLRNASL